MIVLFLGFAKDIFNNKCVSVFNAGESRELEMLCALWFVFYMVVNPCKIHTLKFVSCSFFVYVV